MRSNDLQKPHNHWVADIVTLLVLLLLFYTLWLGSYPLFTPDEGRYSEVAREMLATGDMITPRVDGVVFLDKPVFYYWLQATAIYLFGLKEWALRFFPALFGVLGSVMVYVCGRHLFNRRKGLISAAVLATSPLYFGGAHYANLDLEVAVLVSATLLFFLTGILGQTKTARKGFLLAAYVSMALAFLTKGMIGIVFPILIIGSWTLLLWRWQILKNCYLLTGAVVFLVLVLPWFFLIQTNNPAFLHYFFITQQVARFLSSEEFNNPTPLWFYLPVILLGFSPWTCLLIPALRHSVRRVWRACAENKCRQTPKNETLRANQHQSELFLLLWSAIILVFFSVPHSKVITYILPIFPALALLVGNYVSDFWEDHGLRSFYWQTGSFILLSALLAMALLIWPYYHWLHLGGEFVTYLYALSAICLFGMIAALFAINQSSLRPLFTICLMNSTVFLCVLAMGAVYLNQTTAKPLAYELKKILTPQDEVVNYFKFYQDLPVYLERRINLVADWNSPTIIENDNWKRELWYGRLFQNTQEWLIDEDTFWKNWNSDKRIFVFVNENYFDQFKLRAPNYFLVGRYNEILLFSNKLINIGLDLNINAKMQSSHNE